MRITHQVFVVWLFAVAALCGAAAAMAAARSNKPRPLQIVIRFLPPSTCEISVAGQLFSLPADEARMTEAMRQLRRKRKSVRITGGIETPYRCIGGVIFIAQGSGFKKVGFTAEPSE